MIVNTILASTPALERGVVSADPDTNWTTRSMGAARAVRLNTQAEVDTFKMGVREAFDAGLAAGSVSRLNADTIPSTGYVIKFNGSYADGDTYYISFKYRADPIFSYIDWPSTASRPTMKLAIISQADNDGSANTLGSNPANGETIIAHNWGNNCPQQYYYPSGGSATFISNTASQPSIDTSAVPLTNNDPSTKSAWTANDQTQAAGGGLQNDEPGGGTPDANEFAFGIGNVIGGGVRVNHDEWTWFLFRVQIGTFGGSDSRLTGYGAKTNEPWTKLWDVESINLGTSSAPNHTGIHLTNFLTDGTAGGRRITASQSNITGVTYHVVGPATPSGDGVLTYTSATGLFKWHGNGNTDGTEVGYSADIDGAGRTKLTLVAHDSGGVAGHNAGDYVVFTVVPGSLPGSDQTDNVTVATDGRDTTYCYYGDFIESTSPIRAPDLTLPGPLWLNGLAVGAWKELANTLISDADPVTVLPIDDGGTWQGADSISHTWNGYCIDSRTGDVYAIAAGGHASYSGNEARKFTTDIDVPAWSLLREPYATPAGSTSPYTNYDYYAANEPSSRHTYYGTWVDEGNDRVINFGGSRWQNGGTTDDVFSFDLVTNTYSAQGDRPSLPAALNWINGAAAKDPATQDVYLFTEHGIARYDSSADTISGLTVSPNVGYYVYYTAAAYDSTRNKILHVAPDVTPDSSDSPFSAIFNAVAGDYQYADQPLTGTKAATILAAGNGGLCLQYVEPLDLYFVRLGPTAGGTVYTIDPASSYACEEYTTSGGGAIPSLLGSDAKAHSLLYNRFLYSAIHGGCFLFTNYDENVWFLKLVKSDESIIN